MNLEIRCWSKHCQISGKHARRSKRTDKIATWILEIILTLRHAFHFPSSQFSFFTLLNTENWNKIDRNCLLASVAIRKKVVVYPEFVPRSARFLKPWTRLFASSSFCERRNCLKHYLFLNLPNIRWFSFSRRLIRLALILLKISMDFC